MRRYFLVFLPFFLLISMSAYSARAAEDLVYAGATSLQLHFMPQAAQQFRLETGIGFQIRGGNSDAGIRAVQSGDADIAGSGRFLREDEKKTGLVETLIGWDAVAVVTNRGNPVKSLSLDQLKGIFSGRIRNWREAGGPEGVILVVTSPPGSGMRAVVQEQILHGTAFTDVEIVSPLVADADRHVAAFPSAICALSASMVDTAGTRVVNVEEVGISADTVAAGEYPLMKPLLLITLGRPKGPAARFIAFALGEQGQHLIARHFFRTR